MAIEEKLVRLKMENADLKRKAAESTTVMEKLTASLKKIGTVSLSGVEKGVGAIQKAVNKITFKKVENDAANMNSIFNKVNLNGLQQAIETINSRFSVLGEISARVLQNITDKAMAAGSAMTNALIKRPIMDGFQEYEITQNSIKSIMANTENESVERVTTKLNELNDYADKTVYSFGDMTNAIGRFTAAGVKLDPAVETIKGLSNFAATSGTNPAQLAGAYVQIAQALSAGEFRIMDWNSIQSANLNTKKLRDALQEAAVAKGTLDKKMNDGDFRESLKTGWLTAEVFTDVFRSYAENEDMIKDATQVRTLTQLIDTLKESLGSGWARSFNTMLGGYEGASKIFTGLNEVIGGFFENMSDARNKMLETFVSMGGSNFALKTLYSAFEALSRVMTVVKNAWHNVFPPITAERLIDIVANVHKLIQAFTLSEGKMKTFTHILTGVFSAISIGITFVKEMASAFGRLFTPSLQAILTQIAMDFASLFIGIDRASSAGKGFVPIIRSIGDVMASLGDHIAVALAWVRKFILSFELGNVIDNIKNLGNTIKEAFTDMFSGDFSNLSNPIIQGFGDVLTELRNNIIPTMAGLNPQRIITSTGMLGAYVIFKKLKSVLDNLGATISKGGIIGKIKDTLSGLAEGISKPIDSIKESFTGLINTFKGNSLIGIAVSIGLLAASLKMLSNISMKDTVKSLAGLMAVMMGMSYAMKFMDGAKFKGGQFMMMAISLGIMSSSVKKLSSIDGKDLAKGVAAIGGILLSLSVFSKIVAANPLNKNAGNELALMTFGVQAMAMSISVLSRIPFQSMVKGIAGMAAGTLILVGAIKVLSGVKGSFSALPFIGMSIALMALAAPIKILGSLDIRTLAVGITSVAASLAILVAASRGLKKIKFSAPVGLILMVTSIKMLVGPIKELGSMPLKSLAKGVISISVALAALTAASNGLKNFKVVSAVGLVAMASALKLLAGPIKELGSMSLGSLAQGMIALGVALGGLMFAMNNGAIIGVKGIMLASGIAAVGLSMTTVLPTFIAFSALSWEGIAKGLVGLGGGLLVIAGVAGVIGSVAAPGMIALAGGIASLGASAMVASAGIASFGIGLGVAIAGFSAGVAAFGAAMVVVSAGAYIFASSFQMIAAGIDLISGALPGLSANLETFFNSLGNSVVVIAQNIVKILVEVFKSILQLANELFVSLGDGIVTFIDYLGSLAPRLLSSVSRLLQGVLLAIANEVPNLVNTAVLAGLAFISGLAQGIMDNSKILMDTIGMVIDSMTILIMEAIYKLISSVMDGMKGIIPGVEGMLNKFRSGIDDLKKDFSAKNDEIQNKAKETAERLNKENEKAAESYGKVNDATTKTVSFMDRLKESMNFKDLKGLSAQDILGKLGVDLETYGPELTSKFGGLGTDNGVAYMESVMSNLDGLSPELQKNLTESLGDATPGLVQAGADAGSQTGEAASDSMWNAWKSGLSLEEFTEYGKTLGYNFSHGLWSGDHITDAGVEMMNQLQNSLSPEQLAALGEAMGYDLSGGLTHEGGQYVTEAGAEIIRRLSQGTLTAEALLMLGQALGLELGNQVDQAAANAEPAATAAGTRTGEVTAGSIEQGYINENPQSTIEGYMSEIGKNVDTTNANTSGTNIGQEIVKGAESVDFSKTGGVIMQGIINVLSAMDKILQSQAAGTAIGEAFATGISNEGTNISSAGTTVAQGAVKAMDAIDSTSTGASNGREFAQGIRNTLNLAQSAGKAIANGAKESANAVDFTSAGRKNGGEFANGINNSKSQASSAGRSVAQSAKSAMSNVSAYMSGYYLVSGFASGIRGSVYLATSAARYAARAAKNAIDAALGVASPAKELIPTGHWFDAGFALGIENSSYLGEDAATTMATNTVQAMNSVLSKELQSIEDGITLEPKVVPIYDGSNIPDDIIPNQNGIISAGFATKVSSDAMSVQDRLNQYIFKEPNTENKTLDAGNMFNGAVFNVRKDSDIESIAMSVESVLRRNMVLNDLFNRGR